MAIDRGVVDDDELELDVRRGGGAGNGLRDESHVVVNRDEDSDLRPDVVDGTC
jgi:hypothetical protein